MNFSNVFSKLQFLVLTIFSGLMSLSLTAQEKAPDLKVDVDIDKGGNALGADWMSNPLVWVIGGLVLLLLIVLIVRGGGKK